MTPFLNRFDQNGFDRLPALSAKSVAELLNNLEIFASNKAGTRFLLRDSKAVRHLAASSPLLSIAQEVLGAHAMPVKAILFDKTIETNWYVTWHQDLTIAIKKRIDLPGFGPWSKKEGIDHVQPPAAVLENMVALRLHLDDCDPENGPIKFIAGSHKQGILNQEQIDHLKEGQAVCCTANQGDIIIMRPLILHSSSQAKAPEHRRVLHIEYSGGELPGGLEWAESI